MRGRGLRFFSIFAMLLMLGACGEAPESNPTVTTAELLQGIHDAVYLREGMDAAFIDGNWIALQGAAYLEGSTLMVPAGPLAERRGYRITQRGGRAFITAQPQEAVPAAEIGGAPVYLPVEALAAALGLYCVSLTDGDVAGYALLDRPVPADGIDSNGAGVDAGDIAADHAAIRPADQAADQATNGPADTSANGPADQAADTSGDKAAVNASVGAAVKAADAPGENASASPDWFMSALRDHWGLLDKRGIELDDEGALLHSEAMAKDMLALCDPALGTNPFALRCAGYTDVQLLTPERTLFDEDERATPGERFPEATIGIAVLPLTEGRIRVCISFYPGDVMAWFRDAQAGEGVFLGPALRAAQTLMDAKDTLTFEALSREWGRSITLQDIFDETMRENSRADVAVTGFGSAAAAAQAFVYLAQKAAPSDALVGYTFGAARAAFERLGTQDAPLPIFHALREDDVFQSAGAWFRPGLEGTFGTEAITGLHTPLECLRAAQTLLGADPDDVMLSLAWGLCGGEATARRWQEAEREALIQWATQGLPKRLGVSAATTRDDALLEKLMDPQNRAAILSAHTLDAYAACTQMPEAGWVAQRDELRLSDAAAGPVRLLDDAEAVLGAIEAEEADREALEKRGRIETQGLSLGFEAIEAESEALRLTSIEITDRYIDGPRGLHVAASLGDVLAAFPGGDTVIRRTGQTVLYADPAQTGGLRPPYGRVQSNAGAQTVEYACTVQGEELGFVAGFEARTLRILFDVREGSVARIRMELV